MHRAEIREPEKTKTSHQNHVLELTNLQLNQLKSREREGKRETKIRNESGDIAINLIET
jgi:hypothetical protein